MNLTVDQARELADKYEALADSIQEQRLDKLDALSSEESKKLKTAERKARDLCASFTTDAVGLAIDETVASLRDLNEVTEKARDAIATLAKVNKIINIATTTVRLGMAVMSENPAAIGAALGELNEQLEA
jgi:hypothetical protein